MVKMKDSGIEWIGEIPEDWTITKLKYLAMIFGRIGFRGYTQQDLVDYEEDGAITLSPSNIKESKMDYNKCSYLTWKKYFESPEIQAANDDIMFVKTGSSYGKSAIINKLPKEATINPQLVLIKNVKQNLHFFFYNLQTEYIQTQCELAVVGGTIPTMSQEKMYNFYLINPPIDAQNRIADFLDSKCAKIDSLKNDIEKQIESLEQYKKSVITEAVTKGINPDVNMKDSGIEWIGEIPEHWKTKRGKYIFTLRNEKGNNIELQLLSPTQKYGVIPQALYDEISGMNSVKLKEDTDLNLLKTCHKGDYCISLRSFQGGFEYSKYEGVVSPAYQIFYPIIKIADGYYKYLFKEKNFIEKINSFTLSLRDGKPISYFDFSNMYLPLPSAKEQKEIADYLDSKCASINEIIKTKQKQLETLEEYKKSLIFEYVTGKKEV